MQRKSNRKHAGVTPVKRGKKPATGPDKRPIAGYRAQVYHPLTGEKESACKVLRIKPKTFATRGEATAIAERADAILSNRRDGNVSVAQLRAKWLDWGERKGGPEEIGWKESTRKTNAQRTAEFCSSENHGDLPIGLVDDTIAFEWSEGHGPRGGRRQQIISLREMFAWALGRKSGRLLSGGNPFEGLVAKRKLTERVVPKREQIEQMIEAAYEIMPAYGAWLEFSCYTGLRPGEMDGLRWSDLSEDRRHVRVEQQFNHHANAYTTPKTGVGECRVFMPAQRALARMAKISGTTEGTVFLNSHGDHWTATSRIYWWERVCKAVGIDRERFRCYDCTRHYTGWYMTNVLAEDPEAVRLQLRHANDVMARAYYGHRDAKRAQQDSADKDAALWGSLVA